MRRPIALLASLFLLAGLPPAAGQSSSITVASTTSTEQSGLFGYILPRFTSKTGIGVNVVALGTGQALDVGRRGDADVVFVHDQAAEEAFVGQGFGVKRYPVMYNDFVLIGPQTDPAKIAGDEDILDALRKIAATKVPFISRGDRSGTHAAELRYWKEAGVDLAAAKGACYRASEKAAVATSTLSEIRTRPKPSASGRSPLLVSSAMAVVMVRVLPRMLPPTIRIAPTSAMARPKAASKAVNRPDRPINSSSWIVRSSEAPSTASTSP